MMKKKQKNSKPPSVPVYEAEPFDGFLFDQDTMRSCASATESTGLMQNIPDDEAEFLAYNSLYSYRQEKPLPPKK